MKDKIYKPWFPPEREKVTLKMLHSYFQSMGCVDHHESHLIDWLHQVYVTGDQLEDLIREAETVTMLTWIFYDDVVAANRKLEPFLRLCIKLDKEAAIKSIGKWIFSPEPITKSDKKEIRSWRIRVYCDSSDLYFGYSYSPEEVIAVQNNTPIVASNNQEMHDWLDSNGLTLG
jgi:hypothetical protein